MSHGRGGHRWVAQRFWWAGRRAPTGRLVARTEDSSNGSFDPKRVVVVPPEDQPCVYTSVLSRLQIELPENPLRYTSVPNALPGEGLWARPGSMR